MPRYWGAGSLYEVILVIETIGYIYYSEIFMVFLGLSKIRVTIAGVSYLLRNITASYPERRTGGKGGEVGHVQ